MDRRQRRAKNGTVTLSSSRPDLVALMCPWPAGKKSSAYAIQASPPPTFIASAEDDKTAPVSFAKEIGEALKKQGGTVEFFIVPNGGHSAFHYGVPPGPGGKWPDAFWPLLRGATPK